MEDKTLLDPVYGPFEKKEKELLYGTEDMYGIYQLKDNENTREMYFQNSDWHTRKGIPISKENYNLVYAAPLKETIHLERLYEIFNMEHPADFRGHSMSVSDVVVLNRGGNVTSHFVDSFGFTDVPNFACEDRSIEKDASEISYYVISDISTWTDNSLDRAKLERFDNLSDAVSKFESYRYDLDNQKHDDAAHTVFGMNVNGSEFDLVFSKGDDNVLSLDFTYNEKVLRNEAFKSVIRDACIQLEVGKVRVHRNMKPDEVKDFTKTRFKAHLESTGCDDIDFYMNNFDKTYEKGNLNKYKPSISQQKIVEDVPFVEWNKINPYFTFVEPDELAYSVNENLMYIGIQRCDEGYDYSIYDDIYGLVDGGVYDNPDVSIYSVFKNIKEDYCRDTYSFKKVDYEQLMDNVEAIEQAYIQDAATVKKFRDKTDKFFCEIDGYDAHDIEDSVKEHIGSFIKDQNLDIRIVDVVLSGSRSRGLETDMSDIDVVVEYIGKESEDVLFNIFNDDKLKISGIEVDINPITANKTGTLAEYLPKVEKYLDEKAQDMNINEQDNSRPRKKSR